MNKSLAFCVVFLSFFISTGIVAKTAKAHTKTQTKVVHLKKNVPASSNTQSSSTTTSSVNTQNINNSPYRSYIDGLALPQSTKELLYAYANTPEGQNTLSRLVNPSLVGPTSSSISSPIAFAADWGVIAVGLAYANRWPGTDDRDGLAGISVGFGDAEKYAGLAVSVLIDSIKPNNNFAENGTVAAQLFHVFPNDYALAVGAGNIGPWGVFKDSARSYYAVGSKVFGVSIKDRQMPLTLSVGAGTGAFYSVSDAQNKHDSNIRPFGSAGWRIFPQLSVIGEWAAKQTNVGISILPIAKLPIVINVADCNITRSEGKNTFFTISVAAGYSF